MADDGTVGRLFGGAADDPKAEYPDELLPEGVESAPTSTSGSSWASTFGGGQPAEQAQVSPVPQYQYNASGLMGDTARAADRAREKTDAATKISWYVQEEIIGRELPPTYESIELILEGIKYMDEQATRYGINTEFLNSYELLMTPEIIQMMEVEAVQISEEHQKQYEAARAEDPVAADFAYLNTSEFMRASLEGINTSKFEPTSVEGQVNVIALMDSQYMDGDTKDWYWSALASLPGDQRNIQLTAAERAEVAAGAQVTNRQSAGRPDAASALRSLGSQEEALSYIEGVRPDTYRQGSSWRNYREEAAAAIYYYLKEVKPETREEKRNAIVYAWRVIEQKQQEIAGREGHLSDFGELLDLPKFAMTNIANKGLVEIGGQFARSGIPGTGWLEAPDDNINHSHVSIGQNSALLAGLTNADTGSIDDSLAGRAVAALIQSPLGLSPAGAVVSAFRATRNVIQGTQYQKDDAGEFKLDEDGNKIEVGIMLGTPGWSPMIGEFRKANTYQWVSGIIDLSSWIYLDPINYAFNIGMGIKATKTIPLVAKVSRGRLLMRSIVPVYGKYATGVFNAPTARFTHALFARTIDGTVDMMKTTRKGRAFFQLAQSAENPAELARKSNGLTENLAGVLWDQAHGNNDMDTFYELIRAEMHGAGDLTSIPQMSKLKATLDAGDTKFHQAVQRALDSGGLGIRDGMDPTTGVAHANPYVADARRTVAIDETVPGFINTGVEERQFKNGPRMITSPVVGEYTTKGGRVEVRGSGDTFAAFRDGEFLGMVEKATSKERQIAVLPEHRQQGVGTLLRSMAGENPERATDVSGIAEVAFYGGGPKPVTILTESIATGDGVRKVAINSKRGFEVVGPADKNLIKWLTENEHMDLAAKLQQASEEALDTADQMMLFNFRISELTDDEIATISRYLNDVSDASAFGHGDELLLGSRSENKLLFGDDLPARVPLEQALPDESFAQARNWAARQQATAGSHTQVTLINQMPRKSNATIWADGLVKRLPINNSGAVANFTRRTRHGISISWSPETEFANKHQGYIELERNLMVMGLEPARRDEILTAFDAALTEQDRYRLLQNVLADISDDVHLAPFARLGFLEHSVLHGDASYGKVDNLEIGLSMSIDGNVSTIPTLRAHRKTTFSWPNLTELMRQNKRWNRAQRLPDWWKKGLGVGWMGKITNPPSRKLINGLGKPNRERSILVKNYKSQIKRSGATLPEGWTDSDYLSLAYADVMGYRIDGSGLGLVNRAFRVAGSAYAFGHSMFSIAQLAFRPLPWAGRVLMEEQVRSWMFGLPSIYRNPVHYVLNLTDSHWLRSRAGKAEMQRNAAKASGNEIFNVDAKGLDSAVAQADNIIPGFKKKAAEMKTPREAQALYEREIYRSLVGVRGAQDIASRGNMSMRTIFRGKRITRANAKMTKRYGIQKGWEWGADVPETLNKSNLWLLSDEMQSSVKQLDFSEDLRPKDLGGYADSYLKKGQQVLNDQASRYVLNRMADRAAGIQGTYSADGFTKTHIWAEMKDDIRGVARQRGLNVDDVTGAGYLDDVGLARFYLDDVVGDQWVGSILRPLWNGDMADKQRILRDLADGKRTTVTVDGTEYKVDFRSGKYADGKTDARALIRAEYDDGNFAFPSVAGYFHPLYGDKTLPGVLGYPRKMTNWILQTFGEDASHMFHRQPAYLFQRQQWRNTMTRLGWSEADANHLAHQKAFEMVNKVYFNNQHTGYIINRMNKAIPFFSAQAEVLSTWAWKIPRENYLPLGYARMIHNMDKIMQGFVTMGLVEINESGQWALLVDDDPDMLSPAGRALSVGMHSWVTTPVTIIEQVFNVLRNATGGNLDLEESMGIDLSMYHDMDYKLPIGSPVQIGSHGIMGVNQLEVGPGPAINYTMTSALDFLQKLPFASDRDTISGDTLASVYESLPDDVAVSEFIEINERTLREHLGEERFNFLYKDEGYFVSPEEIATEGLALQVPGSSLFDTWQYEQFEDVVFPYGHISTPAGLIRSLQPAGISYMLRGMTGLMADEGELPNGLITTILGPIEDFQIKSQIAKSLLHLESSEGLVTKAAALSLEIRNTYTSEGYGSIEEFKQQYQLDSDTGRRFIEMESQLRSLNDEIIKRSTDIAGNSIFMRGAMGFFLPATPKMAFEEEKVSGEYWGTKEAAERAAESGNLDWGELIASTDARTEEDITRVMGLVASWLDDPTGGTTKTWFREQYPDLVPWVAPTTFWGPIGQPPEAENFDRFFIDLEAGRKQVIPPDVLMQRITRTAVATGHEAALVRTFGNDYKSQAVGALSDWEQYTALVDEKRDKTFALDMWDSSLNGGSYDTWRSENEDTAPVVYERVLDTLYGLRTAVDEILALTDHADLDLEDSKTLNSSLRRITGAYIAATNEILDELRADNDWQNPREEIISRYFAEVSGPYYEASQEIYDKLDDTDTAQEQSLIFEEVKLLRNKMYTDEHTLRVDGALLRVPDELTRSWGDRDEEEQTYQIMQWTTRPAEWLDLFSSNKVVEMFPMAAEFIPTTVAEMQPYEEASQAKVELYNYTREHPDEFSIYRRTQAVNEWDTWLVNELEKAGRYSEIEWLDAWPIEKLALTGQLPPSLREVTEWFIGIKNELDAIEDGKGPTSQEGRVRLNSLFYHLTNVYFPANPAAERAFDDLGMNVFGEAGTAAIMARLYGSYTGEVS